MADEDRKLERRLDVKAASRNILHHKLSYEQAKVRSMKEVAFDPRVTVQMVSLLWSSTAATNDKKRTGRPVSLSPTRRCNASPPLSRQRKARRNQSLQSLTADQSTITTCSSSSKSSADDEQQLTSSTTVASDLWFTHSELREMRDRDEALCRSPHISKKDSILGLDTRQHTQRMRNQLVDDAQLQVLSIQRQQHPDEGDPTSTTPVEQIAQSYHFYAEQAREQALRRGLELAYSLGHYSGSSSSSLSTSSSLSKYFSKGRRQSPTSPMLLLEQLAPCLLRLDNDDEVYRGDDIWMSGSSSARTSIDDPLSFSSSWTLSSTSSSSYEGLLGLGGKSLLSSSLPSMPQRR